MIDFNKLNQANNFSVKRAFFLKDRTGKERECYKFTDKTKNKYTPLYFMDNGYDAFLLVETAREIEQVEEAYTQANPERAHEEIHFSILKEDEERSREALKEQLQKDREEAERQRYNSVKEKIKPKGFSARYYLSNDFKPIEWIVKDIIPAQGLTMLSAKKKVGKTWFCYELASAVATGGRFLGEDVPKGKVLYIDFETNDSIRADRLSHFLSLDLLDDEDRLIMYTGEDFLKLTEKRKFEGYSFNFVDQLEMLLEEYQGVSLIIIDTIKKIRTPSRGNNGNLHDDEEMDRLHRFCNDHLELSVLITNHNTKGNSIDPFDDMEGSNSVAGATDMNITLTHERDNEQRIKNTILRTEGRMANNRNLIVKLDNTCHWIRVGDLDNIEVESERVSFLADPLVKTIKELVRINNGEWNGTSKALATEVKTFYGSTISWKRLPLTLKEMKSKLQEYCHIFFEYRVYEGKNSNRIIFSRDEKQERFELDEELKEDFERIN